LIVFFSCAENYGSCNRDCAAALKLNPRNVKAWYRAAMACLALDKLPEAADACTSGLSFDAENASLKTCLGKVQNRQKALLAVETARKEREERARNEVATLRFALHSRGILPNRKTDNPPEMEDAELKLADKNDAKSLLNFPVLLLYPLHAQTDFIKAFAETETLGQHLEYILPVPWDEKGEYKSDKSPEGVECYIETKVGGLIKAGKNLTIGKILGTGKVEIVDGLVRVFVVPKPRANEWIEQFKLRKGKQ
jgi:tetratricopeptide (TPR) repeat protein